MTRDFNFYLYLVHIPHKQRMFILFYLLSRTNQNVVCLICDSSPIEDKDLLGELTKAKVILQKSKLFYFFHLISFLHIFAVPKNHTHLYFMPYRWYMSKLSGHSNLKQYNISYFKVTVSNWSIIYTDLYSSFPSLTNSPSAS